MKIKNISEINKNAFDMVGRDWMLISSGDEKESNCMTASWGGFGVLWNKNVAFVFVRPVRHTYKFIESHDFFSLSFFNDASR
jgi:flavin reductase (DIM6/NTAB) family NADH-FMN oxidoreductase RutF